MADQQSNDTIRQMMSGFSAMQFNLGLLPMAQAQSMGGASQQFQTPPPPPQIPHPSEAAMQAMSHHTNAMQQTLQAAQMTRYQPPPSAPVPSVGAMNSMSMMNPFAAPAMGGGGGGGGGGFGGGGGGGGFGGGGGGGGFGGPRMPSVFNPFAPTLPQAHFASPAQRNMQMMQHHQAQVMGAISGVGEAAMGIGGSVIGGALGSAFGPLGTMAGSFIGGKIGGAVSGMIFNPVTQDFARGRQIQQMTSPFMVSGANLNMATGQGMEAGAARQVATGIRHLARDADFERTGFNSQDAMRIMQMSAGQGLLTGAQSPDQLIQKVKDISKTVKMIVKMSGDPDVQHAVQALGEMRAMGFQGLAGQAGAVANRMQFARMAGQTQQQMQQTMAMGGEMAGQFGLVGATGAMAAGFGAGSANVAASSGALNDLQLARAGGRQGLGQITAQASLAAMQNEMYLLAGSKVGKGGKLEMDMDAFRKAQGMSFQEVASTSAAKLQEMQSHGIFDWNTRKQELKDTIAQKLKPGEMQMMFLQQARAFQAQVPGMTLGTAMQKASGGALDENQARALEVQFQSRQYWDGLAQQARVSRRDLVEHERAGREEYRTPGLGTRMGRGIRGAMGAVSDAVSSPFRSISEHFERVGEEKEAAKAGERLVRYDESDIVHDEGERQMLRRGLKRARGGVAGGPNFVDQTGTGGLTGALGRSAGRQINRIGSFLGLSADSDANKLASIADYSRGRYTSLGESFGDPEKALARVQDVISVAQATSAAPMTADALGKLVQNIGDAGGTEKKINGGAVLARTTANVVDLVKDMKAGYIKSARAMAGSDIRAAFIQAATGSGMDPRQANAAWEGNKKQIMQQVSKEIYASGDKSLIEPFKKAEEVQFRMGAVNLARDTDKAKDQIKDELKKSGFGDISDKAIQETKAIVSRHDEDAVLLATAVKAQTSGNDEEKKRGLEIQADLAKKLGAKEYGKKLTEATDLAQSMSGEVGDAMERMFRGTATTDQVREKLKWGVQATEDKMTLAARENFKQKLDRVHKGAAGAGSVEEAAKMLTEDEIKMLDEPTQKDILKFKEGGEGGADALDAAIERSSPKSTKERHSDASSSKLEELDEQIAQYEKEAAGAAGDMDPTAKLQSESTDLFAKSVSEFATAVKDMKGGSETGNLAAANPAIAAMFGWAT